ncbi:MAG: hypothetical protein NW700_03440 [Nitrospiraceae bacterium]|nr:hypothetical protein [Nitrospira tepida]
MAVDSLKIGLVTGDHGRSDAASGQRDQYIHGQVAHLGAVVVLALPHHTQSLSGLKPMTFGGGDDLASIHQVHHEPTLKLRLRSAKEFMQHDRRASDHEWRLKNPKCETAGSEVLNVNGGVENGELRRA